MFYSFPFLYSEVLVHATYYFSLSVCSTTLWVGQLDKRTQQQDVACLLEEFGQIESINVSESVWICYIKLHPMWLTMTFAFSLSKMKNIDFYVFWSP